MILKSSEIKTRPAPQQIKQDLAPNISNNQHISSKKSNNINSLSTVESLEHLHNKVDRIHYEINKKNNQPSFYRNIFAVLISGLLFLGVLYKYPVTHLPSFSHKTVHSVLLICFCNIVSATFQSGFSLIEGSLSREENKEKNRLMGRDND